jgi:hypothetical protein
MASSASSSCVQHRHACRCGCRSKCPSRSSQTSCSSLSCLKECGKDECMLVRQFLDFNPTGPVYLNRVIPVPCCQQVDGLQKSKNRLNMKFRELKPPFFVEVARCDEPRCPKRREKSCSKRRNCTSSSS